jgi:hypothetical protein
MKVVLVDLTMSSLYSCSLSALLYLHFRLFILSQMYEWIYEFINSLTESFPMLLFDFSLFIFHANRCLLYSKNVSSVLQYFHLSDLAFLILITLSHSLFHHTHSACFSLFPIFPCPPFPRLFLFFLLGVVSSNCPLIICIKFSNLSFTSLSVPSVLFCFS